jgi:hypothetical protein
MATLSSRRLMLKETVKARFTEKKKPAAHSLPSQQRDGQVQQPSFQKARPEDAF